MNDSVERNQPNIAESARTVLATIESVTVALDREILHAFFKPERRTRTNIHKLTKDTPLMPSGLFGPVRLVVAGKADSQSRR